MTRWLPGRLPLRLRVALAFLAAATVAVAGLGVFVSLRLEAALEDRLREAVTAEADRLEELSPEGRTRAVRAVTGELHAQLVDPTGDLQASSRLVPTRLLPAADLEPGFLDRTVTILDDDAVADGRRDIEDEDAVLLVRPIADGSLVVGTSREDLEEALGELRTQWLVGGPLALALAGVLGYVVAGAGLRPIEQLRTRAGTISSRTAGERLPVPRANDELRRLARTLNDMLQRLDDGLQRERRFVAEASHDLRTPLTVMRTEIELALARSRDPDELAAALRSVDDEARRLLSLAEHLLGRAAEDETTLAIVARPVDLAALAGDVVGRLGIAAAERRITVSAPAAAPMLGDPARLDRALSNLVDNALRHGAGDVVVDVRPTDSGAVVTVSDEGTGFSLDDASTGLGLSIVREIARAHGGTLEVDRVGGRTHVRVVLASPRTP